MGYHLAGPGYALLLGVLALAAGGIGRTIPTVPSPAARTSRFRTLVAQHLFGLLIYTVLFALAAELGAPDWLVKTGTVVFVGSGLVSLAVEYWHDRANPLFRLTGCLLLGLSVLVAGTTPVNLGAQDPLNYAYVTATLFQDPWSAVNIAPLPDGQALRDLTHLGMHMRASPVSLLWPATAVGLGLDARTVASLGAWLLLGGFALLVDLQYGLASLPVRALFAAGALGAFNITAVLTGGQINQPFALAVSLAALWLYRYVEDNRTRLLGLALAGAALAGGYPEFFAALPLYVLCAVLVRPHSLSAALVAGISVASGALLMQVAARFAAIEYLLTQVDNSAFWWPLVSDPHNVLDVWMDILAQRVPPAVTLLLLLPAIWFGWKMHWTRTPGSNPMFFASLLALGCLVIAWSWLVLHATNANYATFKMAGWLGPGLLLMALYVRGVVRPLVGRALTIILMTLAVSRSLGLAAQVYGTWPLYASGPPAAKAWSVQAGVAGEGCLVILRSDSRDVVMASVPGSAAPALGCRVVADVQ